MTSSALFGPLEVKRFRSAIARRLGLHIEDAKLETLAEVLHRRIQQSGHRSSSSSSCSDFLDRIEADHAAASDEWGAVARELTVPETYFFRHLDQYRAFAEVALRDRIATNSGARGLHILSAGCASGEEAYSLAINVRENVPMAVASRSSIVGVDINRAVLAKASGGRYSAWSLRETSVDLKTRWFREDGRDYILDESIRTSVRFEERNLIDPDPTFWATGFYDVIFWRNVMMYLTPSTAQMLVDRMANALAPGGYLFLGHAETLRGISNDFHLRHTHNTFYYQRKQGKVRLTDTSEANSASDANDSAASGFASRASDGADTWVETIAKASQRIEALTNGARRASASHRQASSEIASDPPVDPPPTASPPVNNVRSALDLLEQERFAEALTLVRALPSETAATDPDVLLLHAVLLTHGSDLARAESACHALLQLDELNAGAHYVLALCREGVGDLREATNHHQVAVYLNPAFAMPRLHLGRLSRRANEPENARRELGHALILLQREDASRLLLFGGGFGRDALMALCRAELLACGGKS